MPLPVLTRGRTRTVQRPTAYAYRIASCGTDALVLRMYQVQNTTENDELPPPDFDVQVGSGPDSSGPAPVTGAGKGAMAGSRKVNLVSYRHVAHCHVTPCYVLRATGCPVLS
eukprot:3941018-Rhodomonas_salina.3